MSERGRIDGTVCGQLTPSRKANWGGLQSMGGGGGRQKMSAASETLIRMCFCVSNVQSVLLFATEVCETGMVDGDVC